ncbi:TPA: tRNA-dihydrouridine synthase [Candidatus Peregrinibacteria bacterium]|nr:tRNA-dihydrouridine synthase [Candidatus Peregrinibacteria bacterium]HIQ57699.1 tRNA-dihydrouridine synthase [Candidatus Gracilibacteria bacterium]
MNVNFWKTLPKPIIGLSPMDGVTDAPMRQMAQYIARPDITVTEFVNVEGLARGATQMLDDFIYFENETPIIAQIYGIELESFYKVAFIACFLGFDGVDINMGCPAKKVALRGAGSGLIKDPKHAQETIKSTRKALDDFTNGKSMEEAELRPKIITAIEEMYVKYPHMKLRCDENRKNKNYIPLSVKTRIGYDEESVEDWVTQILETEGVTVDAIMLHGRTLRQKYLGLADWNAIERAGKIIKKLSPDTIILGNGDIQSQTQAQEYVKKYEIDGVLIGRATFGNPWIFNKKEENIEITEKMRKDAALKHCEFFEEILPHRQFFIMRKHLAWYMREFAGSRELRGKLMHASSAQDVKDIFNS